MRLCTSLFFALLLLISSRPNAQQTSSQAPGKTTVVLATRSDYFQKFSEKFHTTSTQLADLATKARPRLLILYHYAGISDQELYNEMLARYQGHFVVGRDLDIY